VFFICSEQSMGVWNSLSNTLLSSVLQCDKQFVAQQNSDAHLGAVANVGWN
jgi:hypothetical protein